MNKLVLFFTLSLSIIGTFCIEEKPSTEINERRQIQKDLKIRASQIEDLKTTFAKENNESPNSDLKKECQGLSELSVKDLNQLHSFFDVIVKDHEGDNGLIGAIYLKALRGQSKSDLYDNPRMRTFIKQVQRDIEQEINKGNNDPSLKEFLILAYSHKCLACIQAECDARKNHHNNSADEKNYQEYREILNFFEK